MRPEEMKAARVRGGMTQKEMADILGCSLNCYNRKENGKAELDLTEVIKFCRALNITDPAQKALIFLD